MVFVLRKVFECIKKSVFFCTLLILFYGCGSSDEGKISLAITEAEIYLNSGACSSAQTALEAVGNQKSNARYLQTLASAHACKTNHSSTEVFANLGTFAQNFALNPHFGILTSFTSSRLMTAGDDIDFLNLQEDLMKT